MGIRSGILAVMTGIAILATASAALADGAYIGRGGANLMGAPQAGDRHDLNDRSRIGAFGAFGYRWREGVGAEVEGGLRARSVDGASEADTGRGAAQRTTTFMLNARLTPETGGRLQPYAGVGAGLAIVNTEDYSLRADHGSLATAGQAMAGFALDVSPRTKVFAEYRYFQFLEEPQSAARAGGSSASHSAMLGLRVALGGSLRE